MLLLRHNLFSDNVLYQRSYTSLAEAESSGSSFFTTFSTTWAMNISFFKFETRILNFEPHCLRIHWLKKWNEQRCFALEKVWTISKENFWRTHFQCVLTCGSSDWSSLLLCRCILVLVEHFFQMMGEEMRKKLSK